MARYQKRYHVYRPNDRRLTREEKSAHLQNTIINVMAVALIAGVLYLTWPFLWTQFQIRAGIISAPTAPATMQPTALATRQPYVPAPAGAAVGDAVSTPVPATATPLPRAAAPTCVVEAGGLNLDTSVHVGSDGATIGGAASVSNGADPCDAATSTVDVAPVAIPLPPLSAQQAAVINAQTRYTPADGIPCGPHDSRRACLDHADKTWPSPTPTAVQQ